MRACSLRCFCTLEQRSVASDSFCAVRVARGDREREKEGRALFPLSQHSADAAGGKEIGERDCFSLALLHSIGDNSFAMRRLSQDSEVRWWTLAMRCGVTTCYAGKVTVERGTITLLPVSLFLSTLRP